MDLLLIFSLLLISEDQNIIILIHPICLPDRNELQDAGFPPTFYEYDEESKSTCSTSAPSFVRVGDVKMPTIIHFKVRSKSLNKQLADIEIPLDKLKDLRQMIQDAAKNAAEQNDRKGCTTDELYEILQSFFARQLQELLKFTIADLAFHGTTESTTVREIKRAWSGVKNTMIDYAKDAGDKTVNDNLAKFGLNQDQIDSVKNAIKSGKLFTENKENKEEKYDS